MLGPIIGGALIDANAFGSSWRLIFFVNLPLGLAAALGAARLMPESRAARGARGSIWSAPSSPRSPWAC